MIVVAPTAKASGTVRSAQTAAQEFPGVDIRVVDTQTISCNLGSLVLLADDMAKAGESADEIVAKLNDMIPRGRIYFLVDTLEYLAKGGRIGGAKRLVAELLEIKPILQVKNGQVEAFEQQRTKKRALARLVEVAAEQCPGGESAHLCVIQVEAESEAEAFAAELKVTNQRSSNPDLRIATRHRCPRRTAHHGRWIFCVTRPERHLHLCCTLAPPALQRTHAVQCR